jgi:leucyl/phenylalanyl-tRNA--protein transferase
MSLNRSVLAASEREQVSSALSAYARGWFPMYDPDTNVVNWVQPRWRGVIPIDSRFRVSRSLRAAVRSGKFEITSNRAFTGVIRACAKPRRGEGVQWLDETIMELFDLFHRAGHAHSVEAWLRGPRGPVLVGGLYGLVVGSVFCGESMFSDPVRGGTDASKVCLVHLVEHLRRQGFTLLDAQMHNKHLEQFGCFEMEQAEYAERLFVAAGQVREWGAFGRARERESEGASVG